MVMIAFYFHLLPSLAQATWPPSLCRLVSPIINSVLRDFLLILPSTLSGVSLLLHLAILCYILDLMGHELEILGFYFS